MLCGGTGATMRRAALRCHCRLFAAATASLKSPAVQGSSPLELLLLLLLLELLSELDSVTGAGFGNWSQTHWIFFIGLEISSGGSTRGVLSNIGDRS